MKTGTRLFFVSVLGIFGCGDGPTRPKLEAPQITSVSESNVAQTSASISASADKSATFVIHYGETASYGKETQEFGPAMSFTGNLSGLTPGTDIHYAVIARNAAGSGFTADRVFRTLQVPLQILSVSVSDITQTSAKVRVVTNRAANSSVEFGKTTSYGSTTATLGPTTEMVHSIANLDPGSVYHFRVSTSDGVATVLSGDAIFTTLLDACDPANTNQQKVSVTFLYRPKETPDYGISIMPEVTDCAGKIVLEPRFQIFSADNGATYTFVVNVRVNHPSGANPHSVRFWRVASALLVLRPLEGNEFTLNGVSPVAHTDTLPPPSGCIPEAQCKPGVGWLFRVDSNGVVRP